MKKFILITIAVLSAGILTAGVVFAGANNSSDFDSPGSIEYCIPNVVEGTMTFDNARAIYNLLSSSLREVFIASYRDLKDLDGSTTYGGVLVKHNNDDWEFHYKGYWLKVRNTTSEELAQMFAR